MEDSRQFDSMNRLQSMIVYHAAYTLDLSLQLKLSIASHTDVYCDFRVSVTEEFLDEGSQYYKC